MVFLPIRWSHPADLTGTGTFGCNPQTGYEAATYHRDPCVLDSPVGVRFGPLRSNPTCGKISHWVVRWFSQLQSSHVWIQVGTPQMSKHDEYPQELLDTWREMERSAFKGYWLQFEASSPHVCILYIFNLWITVITTYNNNNNYQYNYGTIMRTNVSNTCISHVFLDFFSVKIAVSQFHVPSLFSQVGAGAESPHLPRRGHGSQGARHGEGLAWSLHQSRGADTWLHGFWPQRSDGADHGECVAGIQVAIVADLRPMGHCQGRLRRL